MSRAVTALAGCLVCALALLLGVSQAKAGTYTVSADTMSDIDGWSYNPDPGLYGCSNVSRPGPCGDGDVSSPTPLRIFAKGAINGGDYGQWKWAAPSGVTVVSGSVDLSYRTSADTRVYLKARMASELYGDQPELHMTASDGSATWSIPAGKQEFSIFYKVLADHTYTDKWNNQTAITGIDLTLRDDEAPTVGLSGDLVDGSWRNQAQPVCLTVTAADAGAGVSSVVLTDALGTQLDADTVATGSAYRPGAAQYTGDLCLVPASLADGAHTLRVAVTDVAGETTTLPFTLNVDTHAPTAVSLQPDGGTTQRRPVVSFSVDAGASGLASFSAELDGRPITVVGAAAVLLPDADLDFGSHTVTWSAADRAGNSRDGFWEFQVVDDVPPVVSALQPADGASDQQRRPPISFRVEDAGVGVDAASLRVLLDGIDVAGLGVLDSGEFRFTPLSDLDYGQHQVRVLVSDRSGNAADPAVAAFTVIDITPPTLSDPRPDDGSAGSDPTPVVSAAVEDAGIGIDPGSVRLTLDGVDVTSQSELAAGRITYRPSPPLGLGQHVAVLSAGDLAGNPAPPLTWRFTVRDETPPAIDQRLPVPGSTVPGAAEIGFLATDPGSGLDADTLRVTVDGSDVTGWGSFSDGRFRYAPGNLGAGVHTVAVTLADRSGNSVGPVMWQFAVADPATLDLAALSAPSAITYGNTAGFRIAARSNGMALAGAELLVSTRPAGAAGFGSPRSVIASDTGVAVFGMRPGRTTTYRIELAADHDVVLTRTVAVRHRVTLSASSSRVRSCTPVRLRGTVAPRHSGRVTVQLLTPSGWVAVARPALGPAGGYSTVVLPRFHGRYVLRVVAPATAVNTTGVSHTVTVRVG